MRNLSSIFELVIPLYLFRLDIIAEKNMSKGSTAASYFLSEKTKNISEYYKKEAEGIVYDPSGLLLEFGIQNGQIIAPESFGALCAAINPLTGEALIKVSGNKHRAGTDFCYCPPKCISILWAIGTHEIRKAIEVINRESIRVSLDYLNQKSYTRKGKSGFQKVRASFVAIQFMHGANREMEPHLHMHNALLNISKIEDGKWRTLEPRTLMKWITSADAIYKAELVFRLYQKFPGLQIESDTSGHSFKISGFPEKLLLKWSTRSIQIKDAADHEGIAPDDLGGIDRKFYQTRIQKAIVLKDPHEKWKEEAIEGFIFGNEQILMMLYGESHREVRKHIDIETEISNLVNSLLESESAFTENTMIRRIAEMHFGEFDASKILDIVERTKSGKIKIHNDQIVMVGSFDSMNYYTTNSMQMTERNLLAIAVTLAKDMNHSIPPKIIKSVIQECKSLSLKQAEMVLYSCSPGSLKVLEGSITSGKCKSSNALITILMNAGYKVKVVCANIIESINSLKISEYCLRSIKHFIDEVRSGIENLSKQDALIIEANDMLSSKQAEFLLNAAMSSGAKVIILSNNKMSVTNAYPAMAIMIEAAGFKANEQNLLHVNSYRESIIEYFRVGQPEKAIEILEDENKISYHLNRTSTLKSITKDWEDYRHENPNKSAVILVSKYKDASDLNQMVRDNLRKLKVLDGPDILLKTSVANKRLVENKFAVGDQIYLNQASDELGIIRNIKATISEIRPAGNGGYFFTVIIDSGREIQINTKTYIDKVSRGVNISPAYVFAIRDFRNEVDECFLLATGLDSKNTKIGISKHKDQLHLYVDVSELKNKMMNSNIPVDQETIKIELVKQLSRKSEHLSTLNFDQDRITIRMTLVKNDFEHSQKKMLDKLETGNHQNQLDELKMISTRIEKKLDEVKKRTLNNRI